MYPSVQDFSLASLCPCEQCEVYLCTPQLFSHFIISINYQPFRFLLCHPTSPSLLKTPHANPLSPLRERKGSIIMIYFFFFISREAKPGSHLQHLEVLSKHMGIHNPPQQVGILEELLGQHVSYCRQSCVGLHSFGKGVKGFPVAQKRANEESVEFEASELILCGLVPLKRAW